MDDWTGWAAALFGFILSIVGINYKMDKKRADDNAEASIARYNDLVQRLTKVEAELVTEKEVRDVLKEYFEPMLEDVKDMRQTLTTVKIELARIPRRKGD